MFKEQNSLKVLLVLSACLYSFLLEKKEQKTPKDKNQSLRKWYSNRGPTTQKEYYSGLKAQYNLSRKIEV